MIDPLDLHAYVDGELSPDQAATISGSLTESLEAAAEVEAIRKLKLLLAERLEAPECRDSWAACVKRLDVIDQSKKSSSATRIETLVAKFAPAFCVGLFLCILVVGRTTHPKDPQNLTGKAFARTMVDLAKPSQAAEQADREKYEHYLIEQSYVFQPDKFTVRDIRYGQIDDGTPITEISARDQKGDLSIYLIREPLVLEGAAPMSGHVDLRIWHLRGLNCVAKSVGPNTILVVGNRSPEDLAAFAGPLTF